MTALRFAIAHLIYAYWHQVLVIYERYVNLFPHVNICPFNSID